MLKQEKNPKHLQCKPPQKTEVTSGAIEA